MLSHIHQQTEIVEKVGAEDRRFDVSDCEHPTEGASLAKVEGQGASTISRYWSAIDSLQARTILLFRVGASRGNDASFCTSVDRKA